MARTDRVKRRSVVEERQSSLAYNRTIAFSDGVFSIAITLLVLSIEIPDDETSNLGERVLDLGPDLLSYFIGFAVIGLYWVAHHRFFDALEGFNQTMMMLNLLFLAFIALLPGPTALLGEHGGEPVSDIVYALAVAAAGLTETAMLLYARRAGLLRAEAHAQYAAVVKRTLVAPVIFLASIPVALLVPEHAPWMWLGIALLARRFRDPAGLPQPAAPPR